MQIFKHIYFFTLVITAGCSPILEPTKKTRQNVCSDEITGSFIQSKMYPEYIKLEKENGDYVIYDLTQQATNCDTDQSDYLLFLFNSEDTKKMADRLRFSMTSDPQMIIKNFPGKHSNFQKIVESKCEQMKLNFVFGLNTEEGPVIGCQTTPNTKSAIMFRQDDEKNNQIIIAALSFYEPLLNKFFN